MKHKVQTHTSSRSHFVSSTLTCVRFLLLAMMRGKSSGEVEGAQMNTDNQTSKSDNALAGFEVVGDNMGEAENKVVELVCEH